MIRLIAIAAFGLAVATSAQAMSPAPLHHPDGMYTQVIYGRGVARRTVRRNVGVGCRCRCRALLWRTLLSWRNITTGTAWLASTHAGTRA